MYDGPCLTTTEVEPNVFFITCDGEEVNDPQLDAGPFTVEADAIQEIRRFEEYLEELDGDRRAAQREDAYEDFYEGRGSRLWA